MTTDQIFESLFLEVRKFENEHPTMPLDHIEIVMNPRLHRFIQIPTEKLLANKKPQSVQGIVGTIFGIEITEDVNAELFYIREKSYDNVREVLYLDEAVMNEKAVTSDE